MVVPSAPTLTRSRTFRFFVIGLILVTMGWLALDRIRKESVTIDEPLHLTAGYAFWKFNDYRLQESHGALPERWFALPLIAAPLKFPARDNADWWHPGSLGYPVSHKFLLEEGNKTDQMIFRGRLMAIGIALMVPLAVYGWTRRIFGPLAGLIACFVCAFDPTILAHGPLMTSDVTAALFFLLSVGCFWNLFRRLTFFRLAASTVCFGLLLVSNMSGALVVPMAALMFFTALALKRDWPVRLRGFGSWRIRSLPGRMGLGAGAALIHLLGALAIIWCFYGWQYRPSPDWQADRDSYCEPRAEIFDSLGSSRPWFAAAERWKILPDAYLYGLAHTVAHSAQRPAYLNGQYRMTGWWYYFPYCFLVKTPLTLLALVGLGLASIFRSVFRWQPGRRRAALWSWVNKTSPLWSLVVVYGIAAVHTNLNIGQRHLLPVYLPCFIRRGRRGLDRRKEPMGAADPSGADAPPTRSHREDPPPLSRVFQRRGRRAGSRLSSPH